VVTGGLTGLLLATVGRYGDHRDELQFRVAGRHPDFGYVDQPLLGRASTALWATAWSRCASRRFR
jgi:hypothetical protein